MGFVTFVDETTSGSRSGGWGIEIADERLTVHELIRLRVFHEVAEYNARTPEVFQGLVQPEDAERVLNGYVLRTPHPLDPDVQTALALKAFASNGIVVLVGDRQVTELDEELELGPGAEVTFLQLIPLVGG
ncbi:hypothetical protein ACIBEK_08340 [Nocardia fusca]|uniref:hypothetical protein n=1 Tax=Nocardia fusca TaxID=941183 RepID=UPI0037A1B4F5